VNTKFTESYSGGVRSHSGLDLLLVLTSFVLCHKAYLGNLEFSSARFVVMATALVLTYAVFTAAGVYRSKRWPMLHQIVGRLTMAWGIVILMVVLVAFLSKIAFDVSRIWFTLSAVTSYIALLLFRLVLSFVVVNSRKRGEQIQSVVIVGINDLMHTAINRVAANPWVGYKIVGVFGDGSDADDRLIGDGLYAGVVEDLLQYIESARLAGTPVSQVWIVLPLSYESQIRRISEELRASSVDICLIPDTFGMQMLTGSLTNVAELTVVNFTDIRLRGTAELFKRLFDRMMAFMALTLLSPIFLIIAFAIKLDSHGPILFSQRRYGMDGREIIVWKFRSMTVQEDGVLVRQATRNDSRVTRVGAYLRRHSLDELPQFFNVLRGSMSIVGPRPHAVSHSEEFRQKIDGYMMRHKIKPGITGWAQINGWRGETDTLEKMEQRVLFDLEYIRNWSAWLDAKIILLTVVRAFSGKDVY
jgi:putative colanic acid biosynthesis UDP-glucose lipid carrier transferase